MSLLERRTAAAPGYGVAAKTFHWLIVALLTAQFAVGWAMPDIHRDTKPEGLITLHLEIGLVILALAAARLLLRLAYPVPLLGDVPRWQQAAARTTHALLYFILLALPLLGWAGASARGWSVTLFGFLPLPHIVPANPRLGGRVGDIHTFIAYLLLGLAGLHLAAALYHHFWRRNRVLVRMLPGTR